MALLGGLTLTGALRAAEPEPPLPKADFEVLEAHSDLNRPIRQPIGPYHGKLIDMLAHVERGYDIGTIATQLDQVHVRLAVFMPTPNDGNKGKGNDDYMSGQDVKLTKEIPNRARAYCGGDYLSNWMLEAQDIYLESSLNSRLAHLEQDIDSGECAGVGEFGLMHFNKSGNQHVIKTKPTFGPVLKMLDLIARKGTWLQLHSEPYEPDGTSHTTEAFGALALWYKRYPNLKIILSHTGMTNPTNARRLLMAYPNLMMTIKLASPKGGEWNHLEPVLGNDGEVYEDWAKLFEDMPDRFLIGSDVKFGRHDSPDSELNYPKRIMGYRRLLGSLEPKAAKAIAFQNAARLLALQQPSVDEGN